MRPCLPGDVELAKHAVDRFDVVLDVVPEMHNPTTGQEKLHKQHILKSDIPPTLLEYLESENGCDLQVYEYAATKTISVAALLDKKDTAKERAQMTASTKLALLVAFVFMAACVFVCVGVFVCGRIFHMCSRSCSRWC